MTSGGWETISTKQFETTNQVGLELAMCYWQKLRQTQDLICEFEGLEGSVNSK